MQIANEYSSIHLSQFLTIRFKLLSLFNFFHLGVLHAKKYQYSKSDAGNFSNLVFDLDSQPAPRDVIDPSKSFRTNYQKGQLFVPNSILKVSSGQVSRDLNGFYSSTISQNLLVKSPDCMVKLSAKASSGKAGVTVR